MAVSSVTRVPTILQWVEAAGVHSRERPERAVSSRDDTATISEILEALQHLPVRTVRDALADGFSHKRRVRFHRILRLPARVQIRLQHLVHLQMPCWRMLHLAVLRLSRHG
jgi:hypothetical protein